MKSAWLKLGLRGRLALSIGVLIAVAFGVVFAAVRVEMSHESGVIEREEAREPGDQGAQESEPGEGSAISPIADAQSDVEKTFLLVGGATLLAALLAGYLLASRAASPLRRFAATAAEVDAGDLTPRLEASPGAAVELRTLAESFNGMLDRLDGAFAKQRQFVSDASHELRSPLTAMRGQIEVLARKENPSAEEVRHMEAMAMAEMRRVERLLDDLLLLARLDEGVGPSLREVQAGPLLCEIAAAAPGRQVEVGELAEGTLTADPDQLAQVVRNLLGNAQRHAGRVVLSSSAGGNELTVSVDDDGPGIPVEERGRVFDRFHRSESARDRSSGGSGLGLGIAHSIVERHGGQIWVEDSPLGGARVCFAIPGFKPA
jgi:two-component system, OmpR family, sensor kinase